MSKGTEFLKNWFGALNRGDVEAAVAMCQPDVEFSNPDGSYHGHDGVRQAFRFLESGEDWDCRVTNIVEQGDTIAGEFVVRGRHTKPLTTPQGVVPPTHKVIELSSIGIWELRDGKLAASRGEYDRLSLLAQLGLIPQPAPIR